MSEFRKMTRPHQEIPCLWDGVEGKNKIKYIHRMLKKGERHE
jgi:hypothetical protein